MNVKAFYDSIRSTIFKGSMTAKQFEGIEAILAEYTRLCLNDPRKLAYILATAFHETAQTMQPIAEYGKGGSRPYARKVKMSGKVYTTPNQIYYGRGFVQLTWYENYEAMGKFLKMDLLNHPDLMLTLEPAIQALFQGMIRGMFTGKSLDSYFHADKSDALNARRIINGIDKAQQIEGYFKLFYNAITLL
jgi:hypothetical protein